MLTCVVYLLIVLCCKARPNYAMENTPARCHHGNTYMQQTYAITGKHERSSPTRRRPTSAPQLPAHPDAAAMRQVREELGCGEFHVRGPCYGHYNDSASSSRSRNHNCTPWSHLRGKSRGVRAQEGYLENPFKLRTQFSSIGDQVFHHWS